MKKQQTENRIQNVNEEKNVRELLDRQSEIGQRLTEIEAQIQNAAESEGVQTQARRLVETGKIGDDSLSELNRKREILKAAAADCENLIMGARQAAAAEILKANQAEIDTLKRETGQAAARLRDCIIVERRFSSKLAGAGISTAHDLFCLPHSVILVCPAEMEFNPEGGLTFLAARGGL